MHSFMDSTSGLHWPLEVQNYYDKRFTRILEARQESLRPNNNRGGRCLEVPVIGFGT